MSIHSLEQNIAELVSDKSGSRTLDKQKWLKIWEQTSWGNDESSKYSHGSVNYQEKGKDIETERRNYSLQVELRPGKIINKNDVDFEDKDGKPLSSGEPLKHLGIADYIRESTNSKGKSEQIIAFEISGGKAKLQKIYKEQTIKRTLEDNIRQKIPKFNFTVLQDGDYIHIVVRDFLSNENRMKQLLTNIKTIIKEQGFVLGAVTVNGNRVKETN